MSYFLSFRMSIRADIAVKKRQHLENNNSHNEEQGDKLESQLKEDKFTMGESERKYEDMARKFNTMEGELIRGNERSAPFHCVIFFLLKLLITFPSKMHFGRAKDSRSGGGAESGWAEPPAT